MLHVDTICLGFPRLADNETVNSHRQLWDTFLDTAGDQLQTFAYVAYVELACVCQERGDLTRLILFLLSLLSVCLSVFLSFSFSLFLSLSLSRTYS